MSRAVLRLPLAGETKIHGMALIQIPLLVSRAMAVFYFVIVSLKMNSSQKTHSNLVTYYFELNTDYCD